VTLPTDPRAILLAAALDGHIIEGCPTCQGRGWIETADPFLGGHLDTRCPDCIDQQPSLWEAHR
jgi:hypothetical protein